MPPLPSVPNVTKSLFFFNDVDGHVAQIHLFHRYTGSAPTVTDCTAFATQLAGQMHTLFATANFSPNATFQQVQTIDLSSPAGASGADTNATIGGGAAAETAQNCALVNMHIHRRYRGGKPKAFMPFLSRVAVNNEYQLTVTAQGNVLSTFNNMCIAGVVTLPFTSGATTWQTACNVSYYQGFTNYTKPSGRESSKPTLRINPLVDDVYAITVPFQLHTQRRRLLPS
jgi:hypothetical protein